MLRITIILFAIFLVLDYITLSAAHPSASGFIRFDEALNDVYITVHRQGTTYLYDSFWSKRPYLLRPIGPFSVAMYEKYGYNEGYSVGLPGSEEFNVSAVPYGCFFHVESSTIPNYLDIYVNLGRHIYICFMMNDGGPCPCHSTISF